MPRLLAHRFQNVDNKKIDRYRNMKVLGTIILLAIKSNSKIPENFFSLFLVWPVSFALDLQHSRKAITIKASYGRFRRTPTTCRLHIRRHHISLPYSSCTSRTVPFSTSFVTMTTSCERCCHTIVQKSSVVLCFGPCAATYHRFCPPRCSAT